MDYKLELICVPVSDVDRAKEFYVEKAGFHADHDQRVHESLRFVQLTPPGSGCSICIGEGLTTMAPGSVEGLQLVVADAVTPAGIRYVSVTYDRPMMDKSWSFATGGESMFPEVSGGPTLEDDERTFDLPVNLQPNSTYVIWLNTEKYQNFKDQKGRSAEPYRLTFKTSE